MTKPRAVCRGDRVALVSPASGFSREEFEQGVGELRRLGYHPVYDETVFERSLFTSGPPDVRASLIRRSWSDPLVSALIAVRGGYGSVQVLPELNGWDPAASPKLFVGYSDNTSLLTWLTCHHHVPVVHGPMVEGRLARGPEAYDERSFVALISGKGRGLVLEPPALVAATEGTATGPLFGGTMTQLCASLGTPYAFSPPPGSVLFLEDVNERPFRIDRMLTQLRLSGVLSRAAALIFGEMRGCDEPDGALRTSDLLPELVRDFKGPVLIGFPSGHTSGPCWSLPFGVQVTVQASSRPALVVEESPVE